ncbi:MAG: TlpA family protein disulfide reductase, partial [Proteobacteria bacterium]|nr:TlpA family protein disulfide reductase [Pseudomonadota bacterium]
APDFTLRDTAGNVRSLSDFRGKVVLLNFWASWCGPCVSELPSLQRLAGRYAERGLVVLGVGVDDQSQSLEQFQKAYGLSYPTLVDPDGAVKRTYKLTGVPESFFIDRDGKFLLTIDPDTNDPTVRIVGPREWDTPRMLALTGATLQR